MNSAFPLWWQSCGSCCLDHHFLFSRTLPHLALPSSCCLGSLRRGLAFIIVSFFSVAGLHYVAQAGLKLGTVFLSYSPKRWNYRWEPPFPPWVLFFKDFIYVYVWFSLCVYIHVCGRGQKRVLDHLDQKLQVVVSHLTMGLGTKFWCWARTASIPNCQVISPAMGHVFNFKIIILLCVVFVFMHFWQFPSLYIAWEAQEASRFWALHGTRERGFPKRSRGSEKGRALKRPLSLGV